MVRVRVNQACDRGAPPRFLSHNVIAFLYTIPIVGVACVPHHVCILFSRQFLPAAGTAAIRAWWTWYVLVSPGLFQDSIRRATGRARGVPAEDIGRIRTPSRPLVVSEPKGAAT